MTGPHGPWTILKRNAVYSSPWTQVFRDEVIRPDGKPGSHDVVHLRSGVTVIALDEDRRVHLTEDFHYAVGRNTLEGVSGGRDGEETFLQCAQRELREELGIEAATWADLGPMDPVTTVVASPTRLFLARELQFVERSPEGTEQIRHVVLSLQEAVEQVMDGRITHAATCLALLKIAFLVA